MVSITITKNDIDYVIKVDIKSHMLGMKAAHLYLGTGGAYCDLCNLSKIQCLDIDCIFGGSTITCDVNDLHNIFDDLVQEDGTVMKQKDDYDRCGGQTAKTIPTNPVLSVQVHHALLRTFDHYMKCVVMSKLAFLTGLNHNTVRINNS